MAVDEAQPDPPKSDPTMWNPPKSQSESQSKSQPESRPGDDTDAELLGRFRGLLKSLQGFCELSGMKAPAAAVPLALVEVSCPDRYVISQETATSSAFAVRPLAADFPLPPQRRSAYRLIEHAGQGIAAAAVGRIMYAARQMLADMAAPSHEPREDIWETAPTPAVPTTFAVPAKETEGDGSGAEREKLIAEGVNQHGGPDKRDWKGEPSQRHETLVEGDSGEHAPAAEGDSEESSQREERDAVAQGDIQHKGPEEGEAGAKAGSGSEQSEEHEAVAEVDSEESEQNEENETIATASSEESSQSEEREPVAEGGSDVRAAESAAESAAKSTAESKAESAAESKAESAAESKAESEGAAWGELKEILGGLFNLFNNQAGCELKPATRRSVLQVDLLPEVCPTLTAKVRAVPDPGRIYMLEFLTNWSLSLLQSEPPVELYHNCFAPKDDDSQWTPDSDHVALALAGSDLDAFPIHPVLRSVRDRLVSRVQTLARYISPSPDESLTWWAHTLAHLRQKQPIMTDRICKTRTQLVREIRQRNNVSRITEANDDGNANHEPVIEKVLTDNSSNDHRLGGETGQPRDGPDMDEVPEENEPMLQARSSRAVRPDPRLFSRQNSLVADTYYPEWPGTPGSSASEPPIEDEDSEVDESAVADGPAGYDPIVEEPRDVEDVDVEDVDEGDVDEGDVCAMRQSSEQDVTRESVPTDASEAAVAAFEGVGCDDGSGLYMFWKTVFDDEDLYLRWLATDGLPYLARQILKYNHQGIACELDMLLNGVTQSWCSPALHYHARRQVLRLSADHPALAWLSSGREGQGDVDEQGEVDKQEKVDNARPSVALDPITTSNTKINGTRAGEQDQINDPDPSMARGGSADDEGDEEEESDTDEDDFMLDHFFV
ncbi:hypothetical protein GNI_123320 [Gregarina niphandrodes]|uniref:Uncharacterized protein n=1 Tax=Gregarina niphandrodes TaxID=110365 RepID=A0A023B2A4_GRENI|nr:hypothetical protein GNI_123320 [Gregarina niphandrodes]EZG51795.1 hypothetical protein GNI_123320 [Gregarina niphandrodes]|eukprot:XP_011131906.1 hypothetical protein GNI_123320 [Gregarina niphandrodes]